MEAQLCELLKTRNHTAYKGTIFCYVSYNYYSSEVRQYKKERSSQLAWSTYFRERSVEVVPLQKLQVRVILDSHGI